MTEGTVPLTALARWLKLKIVLTVLIWCMPLLCFPASLLTRLGFPVPEAMVFLRLLGMAYVALVVGYGFGLRAALRGIYPAETVWVGIVSNSGACVILAAAAILGSWNDWGTFARVAMWGSLFGTAAITLGLIMTGPASSTRGS